MSMAGDYLPENVPVILIVMGSAGFVMSVYHLIALCLCNHHLTTQDPREQRQLDRQQVAGEAATAAGLHESTCLVAHLIPAHKYEKKIDVADGEDGTCAVCLGDFEEGEELRTLPACMHSFHVPCIDMWLYSHSSCPICRGSATPSPAMAVLPRDLVPDGDLNAHRSIDMVQIAVVQNGFVRR